MAALLHRTGFRLAPVMWFAVLALGIIAAAQMPFNGHAVNLRDALGVIKWLSFFSTPDLFGFKDTVNINGVTWTLQYEWVYYFALPLLSLVYFALSRGVKNRYVLIGLVGAVCVLTIFSLDFVAFHGNARIKYYYFVPFFFGMVARELSMKVDVARVLQSGAFSAISILALAAEVALRIYGPDGFGVILARDFLLFLTLLPVVAGNSYWGLFRLTASVALGSMTYCLYLLHSIVLFLFMSLSHWAGVPEQVLWYFVPLVSVAVVCVSALVHFFVEEPGIALGRRVAAMFTPGTAAILANK